MRYPKKNRNWKIAKRDYKWFGIYSGSVALYQVAFFSAISMAPVSIVSMITLCLAPVFVAVLAPFITMEKVTKVTIIAVCASVIGTVLIIGDKPGGSLMGNLPGCLLAVIAGLSYAFYNLCGKKLSNDYPAIFIIGRVFTIGALLISPALMMTPRLPIAGWICLLYLGTIPSALAYVLFQTGLKKSLATSASIASLLEPMTATVLAVVIIGEFFALQQIIGGVLMVTVIIVLIIDNGKPGASRS